MLGLLRLVIIKWQLIFFLSILKNSSIFIRKYQNSRKNNPTFTRFEVYWFKALIQ
jgi:hypothetical protein